MPDYKIIQLKTPEQKVRCNECETSIDLSEAFDSKWTARGFEFDGLCYIDKKKLMRKQAINIIEG